MRRHWRRQTTRRGHHWIDAPLAHPVRRRHWQRHLRIVHEEFAHVEPDAAGADDRHARADRAAIAQHVQVTEHHRMVDAGNGRLAGADAGGDDDIVEAFGQQGFARNDRIQAHVDAEQSETAPEITDRLGEFFLARHAHRDIELAADAVQPIEQRHAVPPFGGHRRRRQTGGAGAHHGDPARLRGWADHQFGLVAGARIDEARGALVREGVIQAGLVAGDAGVDLVRAAARRLVHEFGIGQKRPRHRHQVGVAARQQGFGLVRHIDAVRGHHRDAHRGAQAACYLGERGARHRRDDGRNARLVPAVAGI